MFFFGNMLSGVDMFFFGTVQSKLPAAARPVKMM